MDKGLITQLQILKLSNIKPNFSELARLYDLDRRTVKRYYDGYEGKLYKTRQDGRYCKALFQETGNGRTKA